MALEPTALPTAARTVVIGGGIVGCSTAYHLAKLGWTDTVLLEKHKLTSGSTFHAAGLVGQLRTSANITQLLGNSVELYKTLEAETGQATGWKMNGGLRLACNEERWTEVKRQATTAKSFGLEMHLLTPKEAQHLWPLMEIDDALWESQQTLNVRQQLNVARAAAELMIAEKTPGAIAMVASVSGIYADAGAHAAVLAALPEVRL